MKLNCDELREWPGKLCLALAALWVFAPHVEVAAQEQPAAAPQAREFQMTAKKYEFNPNVITVKQGETVRLVITATDRDHGFKLESFGIDQKLVKGNPATIEFVASKAGTFKFQCSEFCGLGHRRMKGTLIVEAPKASDP